MSSDSDCNYSIRHHTHKRKKIIKSDSESSNESVVLQKNSQRKRKTYRIVSEEESSSDESDIPNPVNRRRNYRVISEDELSKYDISSSEESIHSESLQIDSSTSSEWQSDWSSSDDDYKKDLPETKEVDKPGPSSPVNISSGSDSDEHSEKCPICLLPFKKQEVGTPSSCDHSFCLECLLEWSKNINTCPVDRQPFTLIHVKNYIKGKIKRQIPVNVVPRAEFQEDLTFCEVCSESNREDRMLLCDYCDRGYHMECLTPPLTEVPIEEWFCPECTSYGRRFVTQFISGGSVGSRRSNGSRVLQFGANLFSMYPYVFRSVRGSVNRARARSNIPERPVDPNLPSTSSGPDGNGENSRSRSLEPSPEGNTSATRPRRKTKRQSKSKATKKKRKKPARKSAERCPDGVLREVRIRELNDDGEEEETVAYVKVVSSTSRRKCKKRTKKTRKVYR